MSIKEYLEWESQQDLCHEYINGEVFAMTGGTLAQMKKTDLSSIAIATADDARRKASSL